MRLSLKNMLISFALALVVFSVIMTAICLSIYRSGIDVRTKEPADDISEALPSQKSRYDFSETILYYDTDADNGFRFAMLVGISDSRKIITLTPISDMLPVNYKNGIYYASSIYRTEGEGVFSSLALALFGIEPDRVTDMSLLGYSEDMDAFYERIENQSLSLHEGFSVERIDIVLDENGVADNDKTIAQFFTTESK